MRKAAKQGTSVLPTAGYAVRTWAPAAGISRALYYTLPDDLRPRSVTVGARRIIIEAPADWLKRIAALGGVAIPRDKPRTAQEVVLPVTASSRATQKNPDLRPWPSPKKMAQE
jgi:hypothetical protein